jgi:mRNA interferase YafQ
MGRMLNLVKTKAYRRAIKKYSKSSDFDIEKLETIIKIIQRQEIVDKKCKDHELKGDFQGIRECHIESDLLFLYQIDETDLILLNIGSHSGLFE